jgi:hypothetical protein
LKGKPACTAEGWRKLEEAQNKIGALVEEVVEGEGLASLPNVDVEATHSEGSHYEL